MKRILIFGLTAILLIGLIGFYFLSANWGERTSNVEKSEIEMVDSVDASGNFIATLDSLSGSYFVNSTDGKAELLFEIEGLKSTKGAFENFNVNFDIAEDYRTSTVEVMIEANSINTANKKRDDHLKEADYFNVEAYPQIVYSAQTIRFEQGSYYFEGELLFLGNQKALEVSFKHLGGNKTEEGKTFEVFEGTFSFDRTQYGMEEKSGIGNEVKMSFYLEMEKK